MGNGPCWACAVAASSAHEINSAYLAHLLIATRDAAVAFGPSWHPNRWKPTSAEAKQLVLNGKLPVRAAVNHLNRASVVEGCGW